MLRRTVADVASTLLVIVFAVVWMQGLGVLLGPGYLGLIGPFNNQTQVVPILIVALGVDFSIHLLARYRSETVWTAIPSTGFLRAFVTVGVALLLDTAATAIGFLTNLVSPVEFLRTLGVLAAVGIAAAFVLTMSFLPAIRVLLDRRAVRLDRLPTTELAGPTRRRCLASWAADRPALRARAGRWSWRAIALTAVGGLRVHPARQPVRADRLRAAGRRRSWRPSRRWRSAFGGRLRRDHGRAAHSARWRPPRRTTRSCARWRRSPRSTGSRRCSVAPTPRPSCRCSGRPSAGRGARGELARARVAGGPDRRGRRRRRQVYELLLERGPRRRGGARARRRRLGGRVELRTSVDQDDSLRSCAPTCSTPSGRLTDAGVEVVPTSQPMVQASVSDEIEDAQLRSIASRSAR
jgi:hypothetical protein